MARAAWAGETGYSDPDVLPEEEARFRAGPARLDNAGYSADEELINWITAFAKIDGCVGSICCNPLQH